MQTLLVHAVSLSDISAPWTRVKQLTRVGYTLSESFKVEDVKRGKYTSDTRRRTCPIYQCIHVSQYEIVYK